METYLMGMKLKLSRSEWLIVPPAHLSIETLPLIAGAALRELWAERDADLKPQGARVSHVSVVRDLEGRDRWPVGASPLPPGFDLVAEMPGGKALPRKVMGKLGLRQIGGFLGDLAVCGTVWIPVDLNDLVERRVRDAASAGSSA